MAFTHWLRALEAPRVLQEVRPVLNFILIADNVSNVRGRNIQHFKLHVRNEFSTINSGSHLDRIFVLNFVILALGRNTPAMKTFNFPFGIEVDKYGTVIPPPRPQNPVGLANLGPDLVG